MNIDEALEAELARTRDELKIDPTYFPRCVALHEQHVRALSDLLRPLVIFAIEAIDFGRDVTTEEIEDHVVELAQLLLSNWSGLIEHALQDQDDERLVLIDGLPASAAPDAGLVGVEPWFVLPALVADWVLATYQLHLVKHDPIVALTPSIYLLFFSDEFRATRTREQAQAWLDELRNAEKQT
jgi:hypothetical protein